jgi:hypothetical protein
MEAESEERGRKSLRLLPSQKEKTKVRGPRSIPGPQHPWNYYEVKQVTSLKSTKQVINNLSLKLTHTRAREIKCTNLSPLRKTSSGKGRLAEVRCLKVPNIPQRFPR